MAEDCACTQSTITTASALSAHCDCPRDDHDILIHQETCLLFKHETIIYPHDPEACECVEPQFEDGVCKCCRCPVDLCLCKRAGKEALDEWRRKSTLAAMPAVLDASHPLMQKFQETLKRFLEKENAQAEEQIVALRDELKMGKAAYEKELEDIYKSDHDTNSQRVLIEEYEGTLAKSSQERMDAENKAKELSEKYKLVKERLDRDMNTEHDAREELEALTNLCRQLEQWRDDTESDLTISHRMSDKMRAEKKQLAEEKRQLDMILYALNNEVWNLESRLQLFQKQFEIKNSEMAVVSDRVTAYTTELEDLELDKRRLVSLWNSVLVNIKQRDNVFDSVKEDYRALQENYRTLLSNLEITKRITSDEMHRGKELTMQKDKLNMDISATTKLFDTEDAKRTYLDSHIAMLTESIDMCERDQGMIKMENQTMRNILQSTQKELERKSDAKVKLENDVLLNLQDCLLNDKAVESMANGIRKMRDMSRKLEISLMQMENQHAKMIFEYEIYKTRQVKNKEVLSKSLAKVQDKEKELDQLDEKFERKQLLIMRKQRELDTMMKKHCSLKEVFDMKSPQERRIIELEKQIKSLREVTESMQHEWLRLQGHVVKLTEQHHKIIGDINLINKQIQICEQKTMFVQAEIIKVEQERFKVERNLRTLQGQLEVLERTRKEANERNQNAHRTNVAITHEFTANLKGAESEIIELEEEIDNLDKEKVELNRELDRVQREALIWQRKEPVKQDLSGDCVAQTLNRQQQRHKYEIKGIMAVELKRNIKNAKSAAGEIGQMKTEIHRMEVRREQLRRTSEKLAEDLAHYVTRRETALDKTRASAAVEKAHGGAHTSQAAYHHKLRLAKADVARVTKELSEAKDQLESLQKEQERLEKEINDTNAMNAQLEERIATMMRETKQADRTKQWLLERVVRTQRLSTELATAVKRQSVKTKKPKATILREYEKATALNNRIKYIADTLNKHHPYMEDEIETIMNTLDIYSPNGSPRLCEEEQCLVESGGESRTQEAEKPFDQVPEK